MVERKLFKTKLCVLYQRGHCSRQSCSFAHGDADLRGFSGSYGGKRNFRDGDLRDKLDRRLSPKRRYSPARYVRDQQISQRYSPLRSIDKKRNQKKKECLDGQSDFPETLKIPNVMEDLVIEGRSTSSTSKSILEDQLKEVRVDIDMLINRKHELETFVEEKVQEAETLTSQIEELDSQLEREKEQCKKITSRIKKFVKAHNRCSQIEDELRRSQARLQKSGEQLVLHISGTSGDEENSNVNIVSDGETNHLHTSYPHKVSRGNSSPSKKRLWTNKDTTEGLICDGKVRLAETVRLGKRSRWSECPSQSNIDKENGSLKNGNSGAVPLASNEKPRKGKKVSVSTSTTDKLNGARSSLSLPFTSMAAHAVDDDDILEVEEEKVEASALAFFLPPPPPICQNGYSQYEGTDRNVDVDSVDEEMVHVDVI
ncbi:hypothetical protein F383_09456 [Gossypium arboreum]|uniref:Uncharacterized protein n=1 Tax=Gossypium arboreum TaxID=29729 RepID=A0A0B0PRL4_GOSAR|nr:zinc finger CCCH domain-containing protein 40 [Gossypium arboreum]KHG26046.1 hypothetical protein F383_09456 [Gossypium arboreum]